MGRRDDDDDNGWGTEPELNSLEEKRSREEAEKAAREREEIERRERERDDREGK